jgi:hypothetical protein
MGAAHYGPALSGAGGTEMGVFVHLPPPFGV